MEHKKKKVKPAHSLLEVYAGIFIFLFLVILMNANDIEDWKNSLEGPYLRRIVSPVSSALVRLSAGTNLGYPRARVKRWFTRAVTERYTSERLPEWMLGINNTSKWTLSWFHMTEKFSNPRSVYTPSRPMHVLIAGDSLAGVHIPVMFKKYAEPALSFRIDTAYKVSSSLANYYFMKWPDEINRIINEQELEDGKSYDVVVFYIGANDAQNIRLTDRTFEYGTWAWFNELESRVNTVMGILNKRVKKTYWMEVPPMRKQRYQGKMLKINRVYQKLAAKYVNIDFVEVKTILGDKNGLFTPVKLIDGVHKRVRSSDGIHFDFPGAGLVVGEILRRIQHDFILLDLAL